jgi:putative peptide zinc metalloprotease protein
MIVEVFVASLALYVWLAVEPGFVRALAFNAMVVAGVEPSSAAAPNDTTAN